MRIVDHGKANADLTLLTETSVYLCYRSSWCSVGDDDVKLVVSYILQASAGEQADSRSKSCDLYWGGSHFDLWRVFTFFFSQFPPDVCRDRMVK